MPGVSKDGLNIQADRNSRVIEGTVLIDVPAEMEAIHANMQATRYRRSFALSAELDAERIEATLKDARPAQERLFWLCGRSESFASTSAGKQKCLAQGHDNLSRRRS